MGPNWEELIERLADIEHRRWSSWQKYLHSKCAVTEDGLLIPQDLADCWERQIETDYADLSEREQGMDRAEVQKYLVLIREFIRVNWPA